MCFFCTAMPLLRYQYLRSIHMRSAETFGAVFKACCQLASTDFSEGSIFQHGDDDPDNPAAKEEIQR